MTTEPIIPQDQETADTKNITHREKELIIRDLHVRTALMELKAQQQELIATNERLNDREKQLLLRDLEVRSMLMEVKVAKDELSEKNEQLATREKELIIRDLEVRTVLMELKVAQNQLVERHSELETMMHIVKEINKASDLQSLLQMMLTELMGIMPTAEKGSFLLYDAKADDYYFAAVYGYDPQLIQATRLSHKQLADDYLRYDYLVGEGIYHIVSNPETEDRDRHFFIQKPVSAIAMPIFVEEELKGMLFLDNFSSPDAFSQNDIDKITRFREHAVSAFTKLALLDEINAQKNAIALRSVELQQTFDELKNTQDKLILTEKMAALGQVISNMAHEINTPISAINGSALYILHTLPNVLEKLPHIFHTLNEEQEKLFFEVMNLSLSSAENLTTTLERKYRKDVQDELERLNIWEDYLNIARKLVQCGVFSGVERFLPLIRHPEYSELLNTASQLGRIRLHVNNIVLSVTKAQRSVHSYKGFTDDHVPQRESVINFNESIEQVLSVYRRTNDDKLEIVTDFDEDLPSVRCFADQLTQIWTHIVHNAVQAMGHRGKLAIRTFLKNGRACASFTDTGPGIPEEIQDRIFEPFFTTKPEGEGSGLGLHVTEKYVRNHMGTIEFRSKNGETVFTVAIPYNKLAVLN